MLKTHPLVVLDRTVLDNTHFASRAEYDAEAANTDWRPLGAASAASGPDPWPSLTPSELRIAGLVAQHIYTKLGIHSRVELTVLAVQHRVHVD